METQTGFLRFDGHRIAFATIGEGRTLFLPAWWVSHITEDWRGAAYRGFIEALAQRYRVVRYDRPGTGLSDRDRAADTLTLDYEVELLEALVDHLSDGEVVRMLGISCGGSEAIAYSIRNPGRVDRLVLYGAYASGQELSSPAARDALVALVRSAWGLGSRAIIDVFAPSMIPAEREALVAFQRSASTADAAADLLQLVYDYDVRDLLPLVDTPTLVLHRDQDRAVPVRAGREVAALIPGAQFETLSGDAHLPWHGSPDEAFAAMAKFLDLPATAGRQQHPTGIEELSEREREVLSLVAEGLSDADIATQLFLSPHTVHRHVANIRRKLGLRSRSAAAAEAARAGLV